MLCEKCGNKPAVVRLTKIINNKKSVMNLCADCAEDVQSSVASPMFDGFGALLSGLAGLDTFRGPAYGTAKNVKSCPVCKSTVKTINQNGKLGCSECYVTFLDEIRPLLRKIHGNCVHNGTAPFDSVKEEATADNTKVQEKGDAEKAAEVKENISEADTLRAMMKEAIEKEDFEKAAELRDKIRILESEGGKDE